MSLTSAPNLIGPLFGTVHRGNTYTLHPIGQQVTTVTLGPSVFEASNVYIRGGTQVCGSWIEPITLEIDGEMKPRHIPRSTSYHDNQHNRGDCVSYIQMDGDRFRGICLMSLNRDGDLTDQEQQEWDGMHRYTAETALVSQWGKMVGQTWVLIDDSVSRQDTKDETTL